MLRVINKMECNCHSSTILSLDYFFPIPLNSWLWQQTLLWGAVSRELNSGAWYRVYLSLVELQKNRICSRKITIKSNITNCEMVTVAVVASILPLCGLPVVFCAVVSACLLWEKMVERTDRDSRECLWFDSFVRPLMFILT